MNNMTAATATAKVEEAGSQPTRESRRNGWQSDDSVILCGRLLSLSRSLRNATTSLRRSIEAAFSEQQQPTAESWESSDTTLVESF